MKFSSTQGSLLLKVTFKISDVEIQQVFECKRGGYALYDESEGMFFPWYDPTP